MARCEGSGGKEKQSPLIGSMFLFSFGLALGLGFGAVLLQWTIDWTLGYTWNYEDRCIIESSRKTGFGLRGDFCRVPQNCKKCNKVSEIDDINVDNLSPKQFKEKYYTSGQPVVIRNASSDWPAVQVVSYSWLKTEFLKMRKSYQSRACRFIRYGPHYGSSEEVLTLQNLFELSEDRDSGSPWFVGFSVCYGDILAQLLSLYKQPPFLPARSPDNPDIPWMFVGSPGSESPFHIEEANAYGQANGACWQAQLGGVTTWHLRPAPECSYSCHGVMQTTLYPGDLIVLDPSLWFHSTKVHSGQGISLSLGHKI